MALAPTFAVGTLLAVLGSGVGLLAGGLFQDPDKVVDLALRSWSSEIAREQHSAANPLGNDEPSTLPAVSAAPRKPAATPKSVLGPTVQVGAFRDSEGAETLAAELRAKGYVVFVSGKADSKGAWWRVRVLPVPALANARSTASQLASKEKLPTWLVNDG